MIIFIILKLIYRKIYLFKLNNIFAFSIGLHIHSTMSILVIIHSKAILIKTIQTTLIPFNQFYIIVSKHKSILSKSILSKSIRLESIRLESILLKVEPNTLYPCLISKFYWWKLEIYYAIMNKREYLMQFSFIFYFLYNSYADINKYYEFKSWKPPLI